MPTFKTKEELQAHLDSLEDGAWTNIHTQDKYEADLKTIKAEATAKAHELETKQTDLKTQLDQAKADLQAIKDAKNTANQTVQERLETEIAAKNTEIENWQTRLTDADAKRTAIETRYHTEFKQRELQALLGKAGAVQKGLSHAARMCGLELAGTLQIVENNGSLTLKAVDPLLPSQEVAISDVVKTWLDANDHYKGSSPPGPGSTGAGPNDPPPKPPTGFTEGKSPMQAFRAANTAIAKPKDGR